MKRGGATERHRNASKSEGTSGRHIKNRNRHASLNHYLAQVLASETFDREMEISIVKETRKMEAEKWIELLCDSRCPKGVDAAIKKTVFSQVNTSHADAIKEALSEFRQAERGAEANELHRQRYQGAAALLLTAVSEADPTRVLFDRIYEQLNASADIEAMLHPDTIWSIDKLMACIEGMYHRLIKANLETVVAIAYRYDFGLLPLADIIQEGNLGLIDAVKRFDHTRGVRIKTYASSFIRHNIMKALAHKGRTIRIPANVMDSHFRMKRAAEGFETRNGRTPTRRELADALEIDENQLMSLQNHPPTPIVSGDIPMPELEGRSYMEILPDDESRLPDEMALFSNWLREISRVFEVLSGLEKRIISWRFGLDGEDELSFRQIGKRCNLSGERVRQLQNGALHKMRLAFCPDPSLP